MDLQTHYDKLYLNAIEKFKTDSYEIDPMLYDQSDTRYGISLLIRPPVAVIQEIQKFLLELHQIAPDQYYYPSSDMHITVMSIISCYEGFRPNDITSSDYIDVINQSLEGCSHFNIHLKGITASPSCIMIQGFVEEKGLDELRQKLRENFKGTSLKQSLDERYLIKTAHVTVMRFSNIVQQKSEFLTLLEHYRHYDFGNFMVDKMELTYNDWYHRKENVKKLHEFQL